MGYRRIGMLICAIAVALTTACGGSASVSGRCLTVGQAGIGALSTGLTITGGGSVRGVRAVKSKDFKNAYFVAGDLQGNGLEGSDDVGVWVANAIDGTAGFLTVDAVAKEFSDWGDGTTTDWHFSMGDDGASEARDCAKKAAAAS